jgi:hypothetical protein
MQNIYDHASGVMASIMRTIWGFVALCLTCAGWGGMLVGLSLCDLGYWTWFFLWFWMPFCLFLVWLAEPTGRKYTRWLRPADNPQGEMR